jgi:hypothetical protein
MLDLRMPGGERTTGLPRTVMHFRYATIPGRNAPHRLTEARRGHARGAVGMSDRVYVEPRCLSEAPSGALKASSRPPLRLPRREIGGERHEISLLQLSDNPGH